MNQSFTHNKSSHGRFRGASKTSKNSRLCEPRGTFTAHGFERSGTVRPSLQDPALFAVLSFVCCYLGFIFKFLPRKTERAGQDAPETCLQQSLGVK